ncbi:DNA-binding response regulator [[Clostridium] sordellii]|uniref:Stage 0 sporulation protein A homolog n=1 Tax=Paraclostridium sordellii TaxID=1505 RepID=A0ABP1XVZ9_PARSO|nr:LytTR family DNA-binding domain-containing protein [Paeniclostridium sordellii]CEJ73469.1 response regulator [[Clostridium] sordellii] [Paeniclostridium sordellii]CEN69020.1 DNA-binding response regulator [[Clostridium] sordellii] [Paeniclostridium sordellii]CEN72287.1 DNA-binding response regulator [[Clostridium] sordellii] [Paeniclostridium sordellii]CEO23575.1 DNA-binding response regulator [[Clostridium] sordellii] [Paeniclostridium sordellii]CEP76120.1 DNA-binding response regulator [[
MINIAICDDEINIINKTKKLIQDYDKEDIDIYVYENGEELINSDKEFHIIFLDIDMKGLDGIETAKKLREYDKKVKIIYVTNYTDYTYSAFSVHAFGYLVKPLNKKELHNQLDEAFSYTEEISKNLEFITRDGVIRIDTNSIYYFEYEQRKVIMKTINKNYILKKKISEIGKDIKDYGFEMPHKSFVVNLYNIKTIKGYDVHMMDGSVIPLSQKKSSQFRDSLNRYLSKHIDKSRRG